MPSVGDVPLCMSSFHPRPKDGLPANSCFRAVDQATASHQCWRHMTKLRYLEQESYSLWKHRKIQITHYFLGTTTTTVENLLKNVRLLTWQEITCCSYLQGKRRSFCPQEETTCSRPFIIPIGWFSNNGNVIWRRKSAQKGLNSTSSAQFAAQPLVNPVVWFAHAIVNWRSRSVAKSA